MTVETRHASSLPIDTRYASYLRYIAMASALFAVILCVVITINFIQIKRADPLNSQVMKVMIDRMNANPGDEQLRQDIREIDLLSRRAFFTNQWQTRMGGYLLFFSVLVTFICLKATEMLTKPVPGVPAEEKDDFWMLRRINRSWIQYTGFAFILCSFLLVFLTHRELGKTLEKAGRVTMNESGDLSMGKSEDKGEKGQGKADTTTQKDTIPAQGDVGLEGFPTAAEIMTNYPAFRGPGGNGIAYQTHIPTNWDGKSGKNILWKTGIPLPGYNSPIIWGNRIFLTGASETKREVYCVDLLTGNILWRKIAERIPGSPSREPKVLKETGFSAPTMTTDGRRVYAIFANGDILALDFDGNKVWEKNLGMPLNHYGHSSSLVMYHDLLIVQYDQRGSGSVMALSGKTGELVWQTSRSVKISWASPVVVNTGKRSELILAADPMVISYNPADGKEFWRMECISGEVGPSVAYADGIVFAVNDFSKLSAIELGDSPKLLWEESDYLSDIPSPLATGKYLILPTSYGTVVCYDARTGTKYWEQEFETPIFASPVLADDKVYLLDKKGIMHIFQADVTYKAIGQPALGEGSSCTPAFADRKIIVRGDKNLYCIGAK
ncbi:MAG: PQQ-binding-like beta-propeller repeat protein [Bacteroidales bacterium]